MPTNRTTPATAPPATRSAVTNGRSLFVEHDEGIAAETFDDAAQERRNGGLVVGERHGASLEDRCRTTLETRMKRPVRRVTELIAPRSKRCQLARLLQESTQPTADSMLFGILGNRGASACE